MTRGHYTSVDEDEHIYAHRKEMARKRYHRKIDKIIYRSKEEVEKAKVTYRLDQEVAMQEYIEALEKKGLR